MVSIQRQDRPETQNRTKQEWKKISKIFLEIFCYSHRLVPYPDIIKELFSGSRQGQVQVPTARHYVEKECKLEVSIWSLSSEILAEDGRKDDRSQRGWKTLRKFGPQNQSTKWNPIYSQRLKQQTRHQCASVPNPLHLCGDCQLGSLWEF